MWLMSGNDRSGRVGVNGWVLDLMVCGIGLLKVGYGKWWALESHEYCEWL